MHSVLLIALALGGSLVDAFSTGAGSCEEGTKAILTPAAMGGQHIQAGTQINGTLMSAGFEVSLDGEVLTPGTTASFLTGTPHNIKLVATGDKLFRGFLIRMDSDKLAALSPVDPTNVTDVQRSPICTGTFSVPGVTHTAGSNKTEITAVLQLDEGDTDLALDVTVVVQYNRMEPSINEWYYAGFKLNAIEPATPEPTMGPMAPTPAGAPSTTDPTSIGAGLMVSVAEWFVTLAAVMMISM